MRISVIDWARLVFMVLFWVFGLWILVARAMSGADLPTVNVAIFVFALIFFGLVIYREVERTFFREVNDMQLSGDAAHDFVSDMEASAQSAESWVCIQCGEPTPLDYRACIHCGQPSGRLW